MSLWIALPLLALAAVAQVTWIPLVPVFGYKIDLPLIIVVSWGLIGPASEAAQWGFLVGFFLDLTSGLPFGIHMLSLTGIGLLVGLGQRTFFRGNLVAPPATMAAATLGYNVLILAILSLLNHPIDWSAYLLRVTLPTAILNTLVSPLVYLPLRFLQERLRPVLEY